jgi:2-polyprenyl-3-methyl-5-hydroxy-6-metoxy-1,4-benzoquinol methylase
MAYDARMKKRAAETYGRLEERRQLFLEYGYDQARAVDYVAGFVPKGAEPLLDAGTGRGHLAVALARGGHRLTSIDIARDMIASARLHAAHHGVTGQIRFLKRAAHRSGFPSEHFRAVCCMNALHHFGQSRMVLDEMVRILRPGGTFVLSDFDDEGFRILERVHALDGAVHARPGIDIRAAADYLQRQYPAGLQIATFHDAHQQVLVVTKGSPTRKEGR